MSFLLALVWLILFFFFLLQGHAGPCRGVV